MPPKKRTRQSYRARKNDIRKRVRLMRAAASNAATEPELTDFERLVDYSAAMLNAGKKFDKAISDLKYTTCSRCGRTFPGLTISSGLCMPCKQDPTQKKFTAENNMDPGVVPDELKDLTYIEQMLIAQIHPVVSLYKIQGGQIAYKGNVINFRQNIESYTTVLPHAPSDLPSTILFGKDTPSGVAHFRASASKLRNALVWLKRHNHYYQTITISDENLKTIEQNGDLSDQLKRHEVEEGQNVVQEENQEDEQEEGESTEAELYETFVPMFDPSNQEESASTFLELPYPKTEKTPINEFSDVGYIVRAFPCLFPYGNCDYLQSRTTKVTADQYFKFLMQYPDKRFINDARFRFFAMNSYLRWQALSVVSAFAKREKLESLKVRDMRAKLQTDPNFYQKVMFNATRTRSTRSYWRQRCWELLDMVEQIGTPAVFFTLSAADYHWPDLFRLLSNTNPEDLTDQQRRELMHDNPGVVAYFFKKRCEIFINNILKPLFGVTDYWYRYEWQFRGSPHVHGILWLDGAPNLDGDSVTQEQIDAYRDYFDKLCCAINPHIPSNVDNLNIQFPEMHPSQKPFSDVPETELLADLSKLLNTFQRHTKCGRHCRRMRNEEPYCRYNFPKAVQTESSVENSEGHRQYFPKRNDDLMCRYNPIITQIWRANTDFSPIVSKEAVLNYIA